MERRTMERERERERKRAWPKSSLKIPSSRFLFIQFNKAEGRELIEKNKMADQFRGSSDHDGCLFQLRRIVGPGRTRTRTRTRPESRSQGIRGSLDRFV